jgi:Rrf2 family transcriptional regulator, nitric oxide-sensitive transcriptional repressor
MHLTTFTDYSLRVLIFVAAQPVERATIAEVAQGFGISENHLTKVVHFLGKAGFLANVRGRGGGLRLARPAAAINLGDIVRRAEGALKPAECFDPVTNACVITGACRLKDVLGDAVEAFYAVLDGHSLADIVATPQALARLLSPQRTRVARAGGASRTPRSARG